MFPTKIYLSALPQFTLELKIKMKKVFVILLCLSFSSCIGTSSFFGGNVISMPSERDRSDAEFYYNAFGTVLAKNVTEEEIQKLFSLYYSRGDQIYSYKTLWGEKLILVRGGKAVTYNDR